MTPRPAEDDPAIGSESGMVLVEMLAALAIVALMSGLMIAFVGQLRAVSRIEAERTAVTELAVVAGHLRLAIEGARPVPHGAEDGGAPSVLTGGTDRIRFASVARRPDGTPAFGDVRIGVTAGEGGARIVQSIRRRGGPEDVDGATVVDGLASVAFAYADATGAWRPAWTGLSLPSAVRIRLSRSIGGRIVEVDEIARLR